MDRLQKATALLQRAQVELKDTLEISGGCDHSVGICCCELVDLIAEVEGFLSEGGQR